MSPIYLRYKNSPSDPWTNVPSLTSVLPSLPSGALPLSSMQLATAPETETPCGCPTGSDTSESYYVMKAGLSEMPQSVLTTVVNFLLSYKEATYHEVEHGLYGNGVFTSAELSQLSVKNISGNSAISFRLAAPITSIV